MIYYEKYGNDLDPVILCLHGSNFVHSFSKQYDQLSKNYCLIIPHLLISMIFPIRFLIG